MESHDERPGLPAPWPVSDVLAMAPDVKAAGAARRLAVPGQWHGLGGDADAVWGLFRGSGTEPYQTVVALAEPIFRCSCPSRQVPCKHALALLVLWSAGHVPEGARPGFAAEWVSRRAAAAAAAAVREADPDPVPESNRPTRSRRPRTVGTDHGGELVTPPPSIDRRALDRAERVARGLADLDRWVVDCVRTGLTDPGLARYATWDAVAARLVDAQAGALANRVRRLAGEVGTRDGWHEHVLGELAGLHLLCEAGRRLAALPEDLADSVRTAIGWQVRQADVLAGPPETDRWLVCGRSDTLEDRIVVRRLWIRGEQSRRWALLLSFAAYGQSLDDARRVGDVIVADVHRYPGRGEVRALLGEEVERGPRPFEVGAVAVPPASSVAGAADAVGRVVAAVPWTQRWPVTVTAAPSRAGGRWVLTDHSGSLPLVVGADGAAPFVALSRGGLLTLTCEWTSSGLVPLAAHLPDRHVDLGPRGGFHERRRWAS